MKDEAKQESQSKKLDVALNRLRKAATMRSFLGEVVALSGQALDPDVVDEINTSSQRFLDPDQDPIVPLYRRWRNLYTLWEDLLNECPTGNHGAPEATEVRQELDKLERNILKRVPSTIEGIIGLADIHWQYNGPTWQLGHDGANEELGRFEFLPIRRIRHGADIMAGFAQ